MLDQPRLSPRLKVLLISRHNHLLCKVLRNWAQVEISDVKHTQSALRWHATCEVNRMVERFPSLTPHKDKVILAILGAAESSFAYVTIMTEDILGREDVSSFVTTDLIDGFPRGLKNLYRWILKNYVNCSNDSNYNKYRCMLIHWLAYCKEPLSLDTLIRMLDIQSSSKSPQNLQKLMGALVESHQ
jgi:hypothetical protein